MKARNGAVMPCGSAWRTPFRHEHLRPPSHQLLKTLILSTAHARAQKQTPSGDPSDPSGTESGRSRLALIKPAKQLGQVWPREGPRARPSALDSCGRYKKLVVLSHCLWGQFVTSQKATDATICSAQKPKGCFIFHPANLILDFLSQDHRKQIRKKHRHMQNHCVTVDTKSSEHTPG